MSGLQTINDPESLRIKLTVKQLVSIAVAVLAVGGYFTSLHSQVSGLTKEVSEIRKAFEDRAPLIAQIPEIKQAVADIPELKRELRNVRERIPASGTVRVIP